MTATLGITAALDSPSCFFADAELFEVESSNTETAMFRLTYRCKSRAGIDNYTSQLKPKFDAALAAFDGKVTATSQTLSRRGDVVLPTGQMQMYAQVEKPEAKSWLELRKKGMIPKEMTEGAYGRKSDANFDHLLRYEAPNDAANPIRNRFRASPESEQVSSGCDTATEGKSRAKTAGRFHQEDPITGLKPVDLTAFEASI